MYKTIEGCETLISLVKLYIGHLNYYHRLTITLPSMCNASEKFL